VLDVLSLAIDIGGTYIRSLADFYPIMMNKMFVIVYTVVPGNKEIVRSDFNSAKLAPGIAAS
jgi:hypothetical protein